MHRDNAPAHRDESAINNLDLLGFDREDHAQYSPDLEPMDFKVFQTVKAELRGKNSRTRKNKYMLLEHFKTNSMTGGTEMCLMSGSSATYFVCNAEGSILTSCSCKK